MHKKFFETLETKSVVLQGSDRDFRRGNVARTLEYFERKRWDPFVLPEGRYDHDVVRDAFPIHPLASDQKSKSEMTPGQVWDVMLEWDNVECNVFIVIPEMDWVLRPPEGKKAAAKFHKTKPLAEILLKYLSKAAEKQMRGSGSLRVLVTLQNETSPDAFGERIWARKPLIHDKFNRNSSPEQVNVSVSDLLEIISASPFS